MSSGIIGNLMAAFVITSVQQSTFYLVMTSICFVSSLFFLLLRETKPYPAQPLQETTLADSA